MRRFARTLEQVAQARFVLGDKAYFDSYRNFTDEEEIRDLDCKLQDIEISLRRLLRLAIHDTEYRTKLAGSNSTIATFCSSIQNTFEDVLIAVASKDPMQWADTIRMMEDVELVGLRRRLRLYEDLLINLTGVRGSDSEYWLKRSDADISELLGSQESNSSQVAKRRSRRSVIWPPPEQNPRVENVQVESGLIELSRWADREAGNALSEDVASDKSSDRRRTSQEEPAI